MIRKPSVPMSRGERPQQRINTVAELPAKPEPFDSRVGWDVVKAANRPKSGPHKAAYLGQVEWAWSPLHFRITSYYIYRARKRWILWSRCYDDN